MLSFRNLTRRQSPVPQLPETRETVPVAMPTRLRTAAVSRREPPPNWTSSGGLAWMGQYIDPTRMHFSSRSTH
jgi:hypothetical protein